MNQLTDKKKINATIFLFTLFVPNAFHKRKRALEKLEI